MCRFCDEYNRIRNYNGVRKNISETLRFEYGVVIQQITWNTIAGRAHYGTTAYRPIPEGFEINYCPECGKKLAK